VKYSASLLSTWNNESDQAQTQTQRTNLMEWLPDLWSASDPCLDDFVMCSEEFEQMYGKNE